MLSRKEVKRYAPDFLLKLRWFVAVAVSVEAHYREFSDADKH
ncbi:hypothetical protein DDI_4530 [Dickeya dianthicola RNS04.9]|nr:hypothetical protein DDI_4033 [Dickeya dianthicola RNS04.9]ATO35698.1 hypothetical protein DDI_4530 [Dickeya dianthicola RNS04.9]